MHSGQVLSYGCKQPIKLFIRSVYVNLTNFENHPHSTITNFDEILHVKVLAINMNSTKAVTLQEGVGEDDTDHVLKKSQCLSYCYGRSRRVKCKCFVKGMLSRLFELIE